jgi:hypothetical protein
MTPCSTEVAVLMWFVPAAAELRGITIKIKGTNMLAVRGIDRGVADYLDTEC